MGGWFSKLVGHVLPGGWGTSIEKTVERIEEKPLLPVAAGAALLTGGAALGILPTTGTFGFLGKTGEWLYSGLMGQAVGTSTTGEVIRTGGLLPGLWSGIKSIGSSQTVQNIAVGTAGEFLRQTGAPPAPGQQLPGQAGIITVSPTIERYAPVLILGGTGIVALMLLLRRR